MSIIINHTESLNKLGDFFSKSPNLTELNIPELSIIGNRRYWNDLALYDVNLKKVSFPNLEQQPYYIGGEKLEEVNLDKLQYIEFGQQYINSLYNFIISFLQNTKLQELNLPSFLGAYSPIPASNIPISDPSAQYASFRNNYYLRDVGLGQNVSGLNKRNEDCYNGLWFMNNYSLKFLRLYYPYVLPSNRALGGLENTPIGNGQGYIYVPKNLIDAYQRDQNWSTYASKIRSIEDDYPTAKAADADTIPTSKTWADIITDCNTNQLDTQIYYIGATKTLKIDGMPTRMKIVDFNKDNYEDSTGTKIASITWLEDTVTRFDSLSFNSITSSSIARMYNNVSSVQNHLTELYNKIEDQNLKEGIKAVKKICHGYNSTQQEINEAPTTQFKLWIPAAYEVGVNTYNSSGTLSRYQYFSTNIPDYKIGETGQRANKILVRDFSGDSAGYLDTLSYNSTSNKAELSPNSGNSGYIIFGFCT